MFLGVVATLLALDLGAMHKDDRAIGVSESLALSAGYIAIALLFRGGAWWYLGT